MSTPEPRFLQSDTIPFLPLVNKTMQATTGMDEILMADWGHDDTGLGASKTALFLNSIVVAINNQDNDDMDEFRGSLEHSLNKEDLSVEDMTRSIEYLMMECYLQNNDMTHLVAPEFEYGTGPFPDHLQDLRSTEALDSTLTYMRNGELGTAQNTMSIFKHNLVAENVPAEDMVAYIAYILPPKP